MRVSVISPGLQSSIQDLGRTGGMQWGISTSGAMDSLSHRVANYMVGNPTTAPTLEMTLQGPTLQFSQPCIIAICGAPFTPIVNNQPIANNAPYEIQQGDVLKVGHCRQGARAYLAIQGQWQVPALMGSYATHVTTGYGGKLLKQNDSIEIKVSHHPLPKLPDYNPNYSGHYLIRLCDSVETNRFSHKPKQQFINTQFTVTATSNRMGIRLAGNAIDTTELGEIDSTGVSLGSIQMPPSGLPIITGVDGQTTGGYPRIANVIHGDMDLLGQLRSHDTVMFSWVDDKTLTLINKERRQWVDQLLPTRESKYKYSTLN